MFHSLEESTAFIHERDIKMVDLKFSDLWGRWHHVTVPVSQFNSRLMQNGVGFDGSSVGFKTVSAGDMVMVPDLSTGFVDPFWELPTLSFICTTLEADTRNIFPYDPRNIARRAEIYLRETEIADKSLWGPEFEFYVFDGVAYENRMNAAAYRVDSVEADWNSQEMGSGYTIPRHGGYHAIPPQDHLYNLRSKITVHLERMGVEVKYHHHEVGGPGQCEIETPLLSLMKAADAAFLIKYVTRMTAFELDMTATFMPKPLYGEAGSGMHFHQHIWKGDENLFYDAEGYGTLSELGRYYIGGLLQHGAAVMAFTNPSTNSYRRLIPGYEAPISAIYSLANRSAAIRIPKYANQPHSARMEFRPPDATANPYLAMAAQLLAGIDGIRNQIDPTEMGFGPIDEDIFNWPAKRRAQIKALPTSLEEAMSALEADYDFLLAGDVFNMDLIERWIERKRQEDRQVRDRPHPYEIELYYDL
jgi:glutamine synthetase